ncbi:PH domain-containing protein [Candidatus Saccharibacteria bacterium]|nr:PH domain-containing protein [Candidatus Saccharibacteria bacterium]NCU40378.1 PH domain-containing protein [Candidatus Saccharibacteria bacterium]
MESFEGQRQDEEVLFFFRRHVLAMRRGFYGLLIPFALASIPYLIMPDTLWLLWVAIGGLGVGILLFFFHWIGWYYSIFIVTNQRIQQTLQSGVFGKSVIDLSLSKIQNISYNIPGFSGEVFGFGTIVIQTYVGDLVIDKVEKPEKTYNKLQQVIHEYGGKQTEGYDEILET